MKDTNTIKKCFELAEKKILQQLRTILSSRTTRALKKDGSLITNGDLMIQKIVCELFENYFENIIIISEEQEFKDNLNFSENYLLSLDPIDGTENYASGLPEWGVGLALFFNNQHAYSMILLPELGLSIKTGDTLNYFESRIIGLSSSIHSNMDLKLDKGSEYRITGCSMYNIFNTIRGSFQCYKNIQGVNSWDILPGANLALEHNLKVKINGKKYEGKFLLPNKRYIIEITR